MQKCVYTYTYCNPKIHNPPISLIIYFDTTTKNITIAPINDSN